MTAPFDRPDPDALLARARQAEARAARGKLTIFFGASAGVGKTYAMLQAAQRLLAQQTDVLVGVIETHGRKDTIAQLDGLPQLPLRQTLHKGRTVTEFDLDAALARRPAVILIDELAHSNAPGARHPRRWQDIEELCAAGIEVLTTMNVQHLESLNDVVGGITGVRVWETVPDHVFDEADEVVLVDLPPDDLLKRLKDGKVYLPEQAERAVQHFFRKGNLMALRELALRRTAERACDDVRSYRREHVSQGAQVWQTSDALLVCVGRDGGADKVVRAASRRAGHGDAPWHAVYVETPALQRLPEAQRRDILRSLKLAEALGARSATLSGEDAARSAVEYAREHNLGTVVTGRAVRARRWRWLRRKHFAERVAEQAPEIELMVVPRDAHARPPAAAASGDETPIPWPGIGWAVLSSGAVTALAMPLAPLFDLANIVMLFLLAVVAVAMAFGRRPAAVAAVTNVLAFDYFFVPPRLSFAVADAQYLLTFFVMLAIGLAVGQLTASLRYQARVSRDREARARGLYEMARELGTALTVEQVAEIGDRCVETAFRARAAVLLPPASDQPPGVPERLLPASPGIGADPVVDLGLAQWAFDHREAAGAGTDTLPASALLYVPLNAPMRTRGVIAVEPPTQRLLMIPEQRQLLDTYAALIAIAIERVHFVTVAQQTLVSMESERLRNALLAALSHDLRTPLTALIGMAETLADALARAPDAGPAQQQAADTARAIVGRARLTAQLVANLLDMARLESGALRLRGDWQSLEELVGSAIRSLEPALAQHPVQVRLPADLPLVHGDGVLLERVLANLLENAAKYTPPGTPVTVSAARDRSPHGDVIAIDVADAGPGLPPGDPEALFDKFRRGERESSTPGVGLGLAICRAIVQAHGGRITAFDRPAPAHGAVFRWTLPHRDAPALDAADAAATPLAAAA